MGLFGSSFSYEVTLKLFSNSDPTLWGLLIPLHPSNLLIDLEVYWMESPPIIIDPDSENPIVESTNISVSVVLTFFLSLVFPDALKVPEILFNLRV